MVSSSQENGLLYIISFALFSDNQWCIIIVQALGVYSLLKLKKKGATDPNLWAQNNLSTTAAKNNLHMGENQHRYMGRLSKNMSIWNQKAHKRRLAKTCCSKYGLIKLEWHKRSLRESTMPLFISKLDLNLLKTQNTGDELKEPSRWINVPGIKIFLHINTKI